MSIADHFDHSPDAGFIRTYDAQTARRQFQVSAVLILVLVTAAFALGLLVRFDEPTSQITEYSAAPAAQVSSLNQHFAGQLPHDRL